MVVEINKKKYNVLFSAILLAILASIIMFAFYPSNSELGQRFAVDAMFLLLRYGGLYIGIGVILLRVLKVVKKNNALLYVFIGLLNICLGVLSLILAISGKMDPSTLNLFIINDVIGAIILLDIIIFNSK
jgi:hypothetical protein